MTVATRIRLALCVLPVLAAATATADDKAPEPAKALPFVEDFKPERYLGTWYEVARLPTPIQPAGTLAMAEYTAGEKKGLVKVKNTSFDRAGRKLADIEGFARLADGDPPGRLLVSFGPVSPATPNYHVMFVDEDYRYAVVGVPDRRSLWILAREVPIGEEALQKLRAIARGAGFDVEKLLVAPWEKQPKAGQDGGGEPAAPAGGQ